MANVYRTDKKYWWAALFILVVTGLALWGSPIWFWKYILGFVGIIFLVAYIFRNNE